MISGKEMVSGLLLNLPEVRVIRNAPSGNASGIEAGAAWSQSQPPIIDNGRASLVPAESSAEDFEEDAIGLDRRERLEPMCGSSGWAASGLRFCPVRSEASIASCSRRASSASLVAKSSVVTLDAIPRFRGANGYREGVCRPAPDRDIP